jgi:hypothetical protein
MERDSTRAVSGRSIGGERLSKRVATMAALATASSLLLAGIVVARPVHDWTAVTPAGSGRVAIDPGCSDFAGPSASLAIGGDGTAYVTGCAEKGSLRTAATFAVRTDGTVAWYRREPPVGSWASAQAVAADPAGGAWIFGAAPLDSQGLMGIATRAYDQAGQVRWIDASASAVDLLGALAIGADGAAYVAHSQSSATGDVVLRRKNAQGATAWQQSVGLAAASRVQVRFVRIAPGGDVLVAGNVLAATTGLGSRGFVAAFSSAGAFRWSRLLAAPTGVEAVLHDFDVTADGGALTGLLMRNGASAGLQLVRLGNDGSIAWTHDVIDLIDGDVRSSFMGHYAIASRPQGGAYVVATGRRASDASPLRLLDRVSADGALGWRVEQPAPFLEAFRDVVVDAEGRAVVAGGSDSTGVSPVSELTVFDAQGSMVWSRIGTPGVMSPAARRLYSRGHFAVAIASDGRIVTAAMLDAAGELRPVLESWTPAGQRLWQAQAPVEDTMPASLAGSDQRSASMYADGANGAWYVLTRTRIGDGPAVTLTHFEASGARAWTNTIGEAPGEYERPAGVAVVDGEAVVASTRYRSDGRGLTLRRYRSDGSLRWRRDQGFAASASVDVSAISAVQNGFAVIVVGDVDGSGPRVVLLRFDANGQLLATTRSPDTVHVVSDAVLATRGDRTVALYRESTASGAERCGTFATSELGDVVWAWAENQAIGEILHCRQIAIAPDGATWIIGSLQGRPRAVRLNADGTPAWTLVDTFASNPSRWEALVFVDGSDAVLSSDAGPSGITRVSASGAIGWRRDESACTRGAGLGLDADGRVVSTCVVGTTGRGLLRRRDVAGNLLDTTPIKGLAPAAVRIDAGGALGVVGLSAPATEDQRVALARFTIDADAVFGDGYE